MKIGLKRVLAVGAMALSMTLSATAAQWTFMVYLDADNNLESYGVADFLEMAAVGSSADVNIVVMLDRIGGYSSAYGDWTSTRRGLVHTGDTPGKTWGTDIGEKNMGDPATLRDFITWATTTYPAQNYAVVMWNHGGGWPKSHGDDSVKAVCWDDTDGGDCLYSAELDSAMTQAGTQFSVIGFDACLMQMLEVAYQLHDHGSVMVGCEETEPGAGWQYTPFLQALVANPAMTPAALGTAIVDAYYASYGNDELLSVIDLTAIPSLASTVSSFAQTLISSWSSNPTAVGTAAAAVMNAVSTTVIHERHGSSWPGAHGLAIYFPSVSGQYQASYNTTIALSADTQWNEFLAEYYKSMAGSYVSTARAGSQDFYYVANIDLYDFCSKLAPPPPNFYTEQFTGASDAFDLMNKTVTFTPAAGGGYTVSAQAASTLPVSTRGATPVTLTGDGSVLVSLTGGLSVPFFGTPRSSFYVNANGSLTFGSACSTAAETLASHFSKPRVAGLFDDLNPTAGGQVLRQQTRSSVVITYAKVPQQGVAGGNTCQIQMLSTGVIRITWLGVTTQDGIVGLSNGLGIPAGFVESNLSSY